MPCVVYLAYTFSGIGLPITMSNPNGFASLSHSWTIPTDIRNVYLVFDSNRVCCDTMLTTLAYNKHVGVRCFLWSTSTTMQYQAHCYLIFARNGIIPCYWNLASLFWTIISTLDKTRLISFADFYFFVKQIWIFKIFWLSTNVRCFWPHSLSLFLSPHSLSPSLSLPCSYFQTTSLLLYTYANKILNWNSFKCMIFLTFAPVCIILWCLV